MASIVAGIAVSHVPAIGVAMDKGMTGTPYWEPLFKGYGPAREWLAKLAPDVAIALALMKRLREVAFGLPALVAWQVMEARPVFSPRTAARTDA